MAAYCLLDQFEMEPRRATTATWSELIRSEEPTDLSDPRVKGRYFKSQIHRLPQVGNARWLMWTDARIRLFDLAFVGVALRQLSLLPENRRVLLVPHTRRSTIQEEHEFIKAQIASGDPYLTARHSPARLDEQMKSAVPDPRRLFAGSSPAESGSSRIPP